MNKMTLQEIIPAEERLATYKKALEKLEELHKISDSYGLCLLLPKIHFNISIEDDLLSDYIDEVTGEQMDFDDTTVAFPELTKEIIKAIENSDEYSSITSLNNLRMKYLKQFIEQLES